MRLLISTILLILLSPLLLLSCRSQLVTQEDTSYTSNIDSTSQLSTLSMDRILSLFSSVTDLNLSGVTVDFYPPDSAHPDARASPKSISIDKADINNTSQSTQISSSETARDETVNLHHISSGESHQDTHKSNSTGVPTSFKILLPLFLVISCFVGYWFRHAPRPPG